MLTCSIYLLGSGNQAAEMLLIILIGALIGLIVALLIARDSDPPPTPTPSNVVIRQPQRQVQARIMPTPPSCATWPTIAAPNDTVDERYCVIDAARKTSGYLVYKAYDNVNERLVALKQVRKVPDAERYTRLLQHEALMLDLLTPDRAPTPHDIFYVSAALTLATDWRAGESLDVWLATHPIDIETAFRLSIAACRAVEALHASEPVIIHGDLKPGNMIVQPGMCIALIDFGLATTCGSPPPHAEPLGTPPYTAPEQWAGQCLDERADVFALGMVVRSIFAGCDAPSSVVEAVDRATTLRLSSRTRSAHMLRIELQAAWRNWL